MKRPDFQAEIRELNLAYLILNPCSLSRKSSLTH